MGVTLIKGDATERWPLPDNSLDSIVTDPPYGIAFMGKAWDDKGGPAAYQEWSAKWAAEAYRCLKPGGFLLAFGATRMAHRMTCGFEDVGFEILDTIEWLYLQGMTKAQDIGKMFDKREGVKGEVVGTYTARGYSDVSPTQDGRNCWAAGVVSSKTVEVTVPATDLAKQWDGWKTPSLKPSHEPVVVARKPLIGTYCENIERWGVGAINVDACRVPSVGGGDNREGEESAHRRYTDRGGTNFAMQPGPRGGDAKGRFPANVMISHGPFCTKESCMEGCPVAVLDAQSGELHSQNPETRKSRSKAKGVTNFGTGESVEYSDKGGASKVFAKFFYEEDDFAGFMYHPKAADKDRNAGCEDLLPREVDRYGECGQGETPQQTPRKTRVEGNFHPTVKPTGLIRYLQRLVTPTGGLTGSCFLGSGTDAKAAILEGFNFWGMNLPDRPGEEYWPIIEARVAHAPKEAEKPAETKKPKTKAQPQTKEAALPEAGQMRLFDLMETGKEGER